MEPETRGRMIHRPRVASLTYQLQDRWVTPEWFDVLATRIFDRDGYRLTLHLTRSGHLIDWQIGSHRVVEILGDTPEDFPQSGQLFAHRVGSERSEQARPAEGLTYRTCFQAERVSAELFYHLDGELRDAGRRDGVLQFLSPNDRLGLSPMSFVDLQARTGSIVIHAFHTYPVEHVIVKTQSLIDIS